jgi:tRNA (guanine-N7-)-methyltransferase
MKVERQRDFLPSYGRRMGHKLTPHKQSLLRDLLPQLTLEPAPEGYYQDLTALFPGKKAIHVELGFGSGESLLARATANPDIGYIGGEPFLNGVTSLLGGIEKYGLNNIRVVADDLRPVLKSLPNRSVERVDILYPDPWPKQRHWKRRVINPTFVEELAKLLKPDGILLLATDHADYSVWMLEHLLARSDIFRWNAIKASDWHQPPTFWTPTRYEAKTRKDGRIPVYLQFIRL